MEVIKKYFPELSAAQYAQLQTLKEQIIDWNSKINVISRKNTQFIDEHHILHSLAIAKYIQFQPGTAILDIGTGGGFPGLPLAIYFPQVSFYLVDSVGKKIKVVEEVSKSLGLKNVQAQKIRAEELNRKFDFVVSRAVAPINKLWDWAYPVLKSKSYQSKKKGLICLKGGDIRDETSDLKKRLSVQALDKYYDEEWFKDKYVIYCH